MHTYHTTGLDREQFDFLCAGVEGLIPLWDCSLGRPPVLSLEEALSAVLMYIKTNISQVVIGDIFGVSQTKISRLIKRLVPLIEKVLDQFVPTDPAEATKGRITLVDGTLTPCWSWKKLTSRMFSGKHKTTGHNHQVVTNLDGEVVWISDGLDGCTHDGKAFIETGKGEKLLTANTVGDKGYIGMGILTPKKKPPKGELAESDKQYNQEINKLRSAVERGIAQLKTWRILHTDYRRPENTYHQTFQAVRALHFFKTTFA